MSRDGEKTRRGMKPAARCDRDDLLIADEADMNLDQ
jgi:hypothetical protein